MFTCLLAVVVSSFASASLLNSVHLLLNSWGECRGQRRVRAETTRSGQHFPHRSFRGNCGPIRSQGNPMCLHVHVFWGTQVASEQPYSPGMWSVTGWCVLGVWWQAAQFSSLDCTGSFRFTLHSIYYAQVLSLRLRGMTTLFHIWVSRHPMDT